MTDMWTDSLDRLLSDCCTPERVRQIEAGTSAGALWQQLRESGFLDALVPEAAGGSGLTLRDIFPILYLCGRHAVPVPFGQTLLARGILAQFGRSQPGGPITIAFSALQHDRGIRCQRVPYGRVAEWVLVTVAGKTLLLPLGSARVEATGVYGSLEADVGWPGVPDAAIRLDVRVEPMILGACLYAAQLAGAMSRALDIAVRYANDRVQFGRSIGKFQAIQQQLSVMAEQVVASRMAAQMGCESISHLPHPSLVAVAKARTSEAAVTVASIAHAVHGAMGFTDAYDLQLYTRRLHEWRFAYGSEAYWTEKLGHQLLASNNDALDFIRAHAFPAAPGL